jgi:hypothetical protein
LRRAAKHDGGMRRCILALCLTALVLVPAALSRSNVRRCDDRTPAGSFVDCFSGHYHGTGFMPMEETISFRLAGAGDLRSNRLWRDWLADARKMHSRTPCGNTNAVPYVGSFSFYGSGSFIACSEARPHLLNGYFKVKKSFHYADDETTITITHGVFTGSVDGNNVLELVFSDAAHQHYAQPEFVLGYYRP